MIYHCEECQKELDRHIYCSGRCRTAGNRRLKRVNEPTKRQKNKYITISPKQAKKLTKLLSELKELTI